MAKQYHRVRLRGVSKGEWLSFISAQVLGETVYWFVWLNFKNSNSLSLSGVRWGSSDMALYLQCFLNTMDLNLCILVKTGVGLLWKSIMSRKSLCIIFHLFVRISRIVGWYSVNLTHRGVGLSVSDPLIFGFNMYSQLVCFIFHNLFKLCLLYPLLTKCFANFFYTLCVC